MRRPRLIVAANVVAILAALAIGSAFALSGHDPSASVTIRPAGIAQDADDGVQDDADRGAKPPKVDKMEAIAKEFGVDAAAVTAHREQGIGWGALYKLYAIADAKGVSVDELIAAEPPDADGGRGLAFGELMQSLTDEQRDELDEHPKNFGQIVSKSKKPAHAGPAD